MNAQVSSTNKKLFLSAVSSEFESYRQLLTNGLLAFKSRLSDFPF